MIFLKNKFWLLFLIAPVGLISAQSYEQLNPEIEKILNEVVITATKTKRQLSTTTVPVALIQSKDIEQTNALRIQGVLDEYTGLNTVSSALGTGIQLQGLDADYSLIMIDGVPIIGRLNGVLDLSRLSVSNISHIEIVKGPSSVLFGSNALAGVVNIITQSPKNEKSIELSSKASSFQTYDFAINGLYSKNKYKGIVSANSYSTSGYDLASNYQGYNLSTDYYGKTVSPHSNFSLSIQNGYKFSDQLDVHLNARYFNESEKYDFVDNSGAVIHGKGKIVDWSVKPWISYQFSPKIKSTIRYSYNQYGTETNENFHENDALFSHSFYNENYGLFEWQNDFTLNQKHEFTLGAGYEMEGVQTSRLSDDQFHNANNKFLYLQYILNYKDNLNVVLGSRYEQHNNYSSQFNPKVSFKYNIAPQYVIKASVGRGFKKPDFKQLYFNYTNNAIGYTVLGTTYVEEGMNNLLSQNEIAINPENNQLVIYDLYYDILEDGGKIDAESSTGVNLGMSIRSIKNTIIDFNLFRNDLQNLIETTPIALKKNGWQAYSYQNINRVYTQGAEFDVKYYWGDHLKICAGYQYLDAKDKKVVKQLKDGELFAKDLESGVSYKIPKNGYGGLLNRANHNANFKIFATDIWKGIDANIRVLYKGKFGFADLNNNQILDVEQEYVPGYFLMNVTIQKTFLDKKMNIKFGVDNLLNYTYATPEFTISSLPGRIFYTSINYKFIKNEKY